MIANLIVVLTIFLSINIGRTKKRKEGKEEQERQEGEEGKEGHQRAVF